MYCRRCGSDGGEGLSYCRRCGAELETAPLARASGGPTEKAPGARGLRRAAPRDPGEMTAEGVGSVIVGDGFFITALILSATHTPVSSMLWLLLLLPAFYCFGRGMRDILHARQIRQRDKRAELAASKPKAGLPPPRASVADFIGGRASGELLRGPRAARRTTGEL